MKSVFALFVSLLGFAAAAQPVCSEEARLQKAGLVDVRTVDPALLVDLKYSTADNFMKKDVYGCITRCFLQPETARKLKKAHDWLRARHPGLRLLVYDGARSRAVQWKLWEALPHLSAGQRENYVANPRKGSIHNYGCAVDLTIAKADGSPLGGTPLDMGTPFDFFGPEAYPRKEAEMLRLKKITPAQVENRKLLRAAMSQAGFGGITSEWWHFNALSLQQAKSRYGLIE